jgi:hypothetical protein
MYNTPQLPQLLVDHGFLAARGGAVDLRQLRGLFLLAYCEIRELWDIGPGGERLRWCVT